MASKIEGKAKVTACSWNDINDLKLWSKKDLIGDFHCMKVLERFPNCSTKSLNKEPSSLAFFTALDPTEYWGMIREWMYLFLKTVK